MKQYAISRYLPLYAYKKNDIRLLRMANDEVINNENLKIPHPLLQERRFTMAPLHEIAENLTHPLYNKTIQDLFDDCKDNSVVTKIKGSI